MLSADFLKDYETSFSMSFCKNLFLVVVKLILGLDAAIAVSRDHKPDQTDERQRIEEAGGFVMWAGTYFFCKLLLQLDCSDI